MNSIFNRLLAGAMRPVLHYMSRNRLPTLDGDLHLDGLQASVNVYRDQWGIPHIYADNRADLFFAQGFVHAQERLWQMELNRRCARGELAAVLGGAALEVDRLTRTLGFGRLGETTWKLVDEQVRQDAVAYTAGVNAYLASQPALPVEFRLLGLRPRPWHPQDSFAFGRLLLWSLSYGWAGELVRAQLGEKLGPELSAELEPVYPKQNPSSLPQGIEFNRLTVDGMLHAAAGPLLGKGRLDGGGRGSNGWVIAAHRSTTGHALLCNDMHLPLTTPSLWYYWHLNGPEYHVAGVSQPGLPYVLVGHNDDIAWGATLAFTDCEDLFIEKLHPSGDGRYRFRGEWRKGEVIEERIAVKGAVDHVEKVRLTHHGPIISNMLAPGGAALALSAMALRPDRAFNGFARLNQARNWDDFVAAVADIAAPPLNLLYADRQDNIGYWVTGRVPVRDQGEGLVPAPGWTGDHEWIDTVPFEEMPHALNPERGFLVTANNRIIDDSYPHFLGHLWMNGYRAKRLETLIEEQGQVSPEDCQRFQFDLLCLPGLALVEHLADLEPDDPDAALSLRLLREWDGRLDINSVGGTVYHFLVARLTELILKPDLQELFLPALGEGPHPILYPISEFYGHWTVNLLRILSNPDSRWLGGRIGRRALLHRGLAETTAELRSRLGPEPRGWQWGRLHQITFNHALAVQPPLDQIFCQGPYPIGGSTDTVLQAATAPGGDYDEIHFSVSYRQIINLGELGDSRAMFAPGQSGHLASPHYGDLIEPWLNGSYFRMLWSREEVTAAAHHVLRLRRSRTADS